MSPLYKNGALRRVVLPLLHRFNPGDITIRHHHTGDKLFLHSFRHKGYWFHGRRREADTMLAFKSLLRPGDTVIEVGGHIGYLSLYFAKLVGPSGTVRVFEPGPNNLPYLHRNVDPVSTIRVVEKGVGDKAGTADFFVEGLTGQNNSFVRNFDGLEMNSRNASVSTTAQAIKVEVITLDQYVASEGIKPNLIKIDVEGFEFPVLLGAGDVLRKHRPMLMVEIQADYDAIVNYADSLGYDIVSPEGRMVNLDPSFRGNTFWLHREAHAGFANTLKSLARSSG